MGSGAGKRNRTPDLLITNELLYRLSYSGWRQNYSRHFWPWRSQRTPSERTGITPGDKR
jgi:hypothetical protein